MTPPRTVTETVVDCDGVEIAASVRGSGPAVLLLHGYPETRAMWADVAASLAEHHTVVAADLRGYGDSAKPHGEHYAKRDMAQDQVALMRQLGHTRFAVVGHDRGARVGHRMALDHPDAVSALAVLDIVPTLHMFENVDREMATVYFHWFFLARADGLPEALIGAEPETWLRSRFRGRRHDGDGLPAAYPEYLRCFDADTVRASCADYRAAATVDLDHDRADREAGRVVECPTLALWGAHSYVGRNFDVLDAWRPFAPEIVGQPVEADHYLAEEAPAATATALRAFLAEGGGMSAQDRDVERLAALVSIETPTGDADGLASAQRLVRSWLDPVLGAPVVETVDGVDHLLWTGGDAPSVLLLGHLDTVFPAGTTRERPFRVDGDRATGPGVFDMKAGVVIMAAALERAARPGRVAVLLTGDEETGSLTSRGLIEREAARAGTVLVLEPSLDGAVKVARRGGSIYRLDVTGRAAHAGLEPSKGRSALTELAHHVLSLPALADDERGTTVNPTVARAGTATNVIPEHAEMRVDVRAWSLDELERVDERMRALVPHTDDVTVEVSGGINRPPMEDVVATELLACARRVAARLGHPEVVAVSAGGASDGNFTAAVGARTLDGLGPRGGGAHAEHEWISLASLHERIALLAGMLDDLTAGSNG